MPAKPHERQYRNMAQPLVAIVIENDEKEERTNRFGCERYVEGYATTFEDPYLLWEESDWVDDFGNFHQGWKYYEVVDRNALEGADMSDVIFVLDHEGEVMGRNRNGLVYLEPDGHGLFCAINMDMTRFAHDVYDGIKCRNYEDMSWAFTIAEQEVTEDPETRTVTTRIKRIKKVFDVSVVSRGADPNTEISARDMLDGEIEARHMQELHEAEAKAKAEAARMAHMVLAMRAKAIDLQ